MADRGTITGTKQDGNAMLDFALDYERNGSSVTFTARTITTYHWCAWGYEGYPIFLGNNSEFMTVTVDGRSGNTVTCVNGINYGIPAISAGWVHDDFVHTGQSTITVPLKGGAYSVTINFTGNGGVSESYTILIATPSTIATVTGNKEINSQQTINISRASSDLTHTITFTCGNASGTIVSATNAISVNWTPPYSLCDQVTNSRSVPVTFKLYTYSGNQAIGNTTYSATFTIPDNAETKPSVSLSVSADNTGLPAKYSGMYIQGKSKVRSAFTASGKHGATISQYASTVNSKTVTGNPSVSALLSISGDSIVTGTVTDSRGIKNSAIQTITVQPYTPPALIPHTGYANIIVSRCNEFGIETLDGTSLLIRAGRKYTSLNGMNSCSISFRWKAQSSQTYSVWTTILAAGSTSDNVDVVISDIVFQPTIAYDVQLRVQDELEDSAPILFLLLTDEVPLHLGQGGSAVGVGRFVDPGYGKSFQIGWKTYLLNDAEISGDVEVTGDIEITGDTGITGNEEISGDLAVSGEITKGGKTILDLAYPVGSIYMSVNSTNPGTLFGGTWQEIHGRFLFGRDSSHTAGTTGGEATHTLTVAEMPSHRHEESNRVNWYDSPGSSAISGWDWGNDNLCVDRAADYTDYIGGGQAHNNMPPYLAVYIWKRTA